MKYYEMGSILKRKNLLISNRDFNYGRNRVRPHSKNETWEHWLMKALLFKHMFNNGDGVLTEHELPSGEVIDLLQIKKGDAIAYEIQTNREKHVRYENKYEMDTIQIELKDMPTVVREAIRVLVIYSKDFVI